MKWQDIQKQLFDERDNTEAETVQKEVKEEKVVELNERKEEIKRVEKEVTIIHKLTKFQGNIETQDDLVIYGSLTGDILSEGDVKVYGEVSGNISCHTACLYEASIAGDINCSSAMEITQNSVVHGNINAINLTCGGHIKGDIAVEELIHLQQTGAVLGNITALEIEIDRGAIVQGMVHITEEIEI